jgi:Protein of unknown function (DUF4013)
MDIARAFTYVFDDRDWVNKIGITAIITALSFLLTPLIVGLLGWAALFGYLVELVRNVRLGNPQPLPRWDNFNRYVSNGFNVVTAFVVYNLPNIALGCVSTILAQNLGSGLVGSTLVLALSCCLFPVLLIYNLLTLPMLALAIGRYVEDPRVNVFFEFASLLKELRRSLDHVLQWWLAVIIVDIVFAICGAIPVIGWAALVALLIPVYGMLTGQFAILMWGKLKDKPKNPSPIRR